MAADTAISIGNFDGVHLGHQALVRAARRAVGETGRVIAMAFERHPATVLAPDRAPPPLGTLEQRRRWLRQAGADELVPIETSESMLARTPQEFIEDEVMPRRPACIVEGEDFRFGRGRAGTIETLQSIGRTKGFETIVVPPVESALSDSSIVRVSSTLIRWLVTRGRVRDAMFLLGRPFEIESTVVEGARRGAEIGVPTANLAPTECLLPADGVYAGWARAGDGEMYRAAISVGTNPTFTDAARRCEAHLIGYESAVEYGWPIRLQFAFWLREQLRYDDVARLIAQITRDVHRTRELLGKAAADTHR